MPTSAARSTPPQKLSPSLYSSIPHFEDYATEYRKNLVLDTNRSFEIDIIKKELKKADGQIARTVAQSPVNIGKKAVDIALDILEGKDFEKETSVDVFMINKENVEMYGADGWQ